MRTDALRVVVVQPRAWSSDGQRNLDSVGRLLDTSGGAIQGQDLVILPELVGAEMDHRRYLRSIQRLARARRTWVVGGSHHHTHRARTVNTGAVVDPTGDVVAEYDKLHPYGVDTEAGVDPGHRLGLFHLGGRQVLVLVCADFWHSRLLHEAPARPDLIAVPSFSVSRWRPSTPARRIWRHMAISRAYEFGAFVAISDWSTSAEHRGKASAGAGGIAHPYPRPGERLFDRLGRRRVARMQLDMGAIDTLRRDRVERRFLSEWTGRPGRLASHSDGQPANSHGGPIGDTGAGVPDLSGSE